MVSFGFCGGVCTVRLTVLLLAVTMYLGLCVDQSFGFFTSCTTPTYAGNHVKTRTEAVTTMTVPEASKLKSLSFSLLSSTVIDSPSTTRTEGETIVEILKDRDLESEGKNGKDGWEIRLFNDPFNHRTFVAKCLCTICGKTDGESYQIMMQAHKNGMGVVGRYHYEIAELYHGSLKKEGLTVDMVQVDDE